MHNQQNWAEFENAFVSGWLRNFLSNTFFLIFIHPLFCHENEKRSYFSSAPKFVLYASLIRRTLIVERFCKASSVCVYTQVIRCNIFGSVQQNVDIRWLYVGMNFICIHHSVNCAAKNIQCLFQCCSLYINRMKTVSVSCTFNVCTLCWLPCV